MNFLDRTSIEAIHNPIFFGENVNFSSVLSHHKKINGRVEKVRADHEKFFFLGNVCFSIMPLRYSQSLGYILFLAYLLIVFLLLIVQYKARSILECYPLLTKLLPSKRLLIRAPPMLHLALIETMPSSKIINSTNTQLSDQ